ncbi:MAG: hypothetical protein JNM57_07155 [Cyclobacteriaceae bacterium]|nr:hypothetical protein [Cyclobacteriaceae bacterium]
MRKFLFALIGFILVFVRMGIGQESYRIFIDPSSRITVDGSTNVNRFTFRYTEQITIDKPVKVDRIDRKLKLKGGVIDLKVSAFDSGNGLMNKDFRKMLKEEENPFIQVELASINPTWKTSELWLDGKVEILITLNSIARKYVVPCKIENPGSLLIYGKQTLQLADFNLEAPTRMMGMVKVNEQVEFDFALRFATDK